MAKVRIVIDVYQGIVASVLCSDEDAEVEVKDWDSVPENEPQYTDLDENVPPGMFEVYC